MPVRLSVDAIGQPSTVNGLIPPGVPPKTYDVVAALRNWVTVGVGRVSGPE
jgi:hypothetical protein